MFLVVSQTFCQASRFFKSRTFTLKGTKCALLLVRGHELDQDFMMAVYISYSCFLQGFYDFLLCWHKHGSSLEIFVQRQEFFVTHGIAIQAWSSKRFRCSLLHMVYFMSKFREMFAAKLAEKLRLSPQLSVLRMAGRLLPWI